MAVLRRFRKRQRAERHPGATMNEGNPMVLRTPFDRIAVHDGAIFLWHSGSGAQLHVPADAGAYLTGIWAEDASNG